MAKNILVSAASLTFNVLFKICKSRVPRDEVVFLSRQTNVPSFDFEEIAREFERRGWKTHMHLKKVSNRNLPSYALHVLKELRLLGVCKIAVLDRYDPVVSLLEFDCEQSGVTSFGEMSRDASCVNTQFPRRPVVLQIWHAFGAFKKFGHQSVGTPEGHSAVFTSTFNIHRNYSWVFCSGEGARKGFAEAFSCPIERVVAMDRPEYDELALKARERARTHGSDESGRVKVLMAPTLRINEESAHPFRELYGHRAMFEHALGEAGARIMWSFHPLESDLPAPGNVSQQLLDCDCVVTDYSSIVYEAYLLGIPVFFYIPDIQSYRESPGLNTDPASTSATLCAFSEEQLVDLLTSFARSPQSYSRDALETFAASAFEIPLERSSSAASRIVDFALAHV